MAPVRILEGFLVGFHLLLLGHFFNGLGIWRILRWLRFRFLFVSHDAITLHLPPRLGNSFSHRRRRIGHTLGPLAKGSGSCLPFVPCQIGWLPLGLRA